MVHTRACDARSRTRWTRVLQCAFSKWSLHWYFCMNSQLKEGWRIKMDLNSCVATRLLCMHLLNYCLIAVAVKRIKTWSEQFILTMFWLIDPSVCCCIAGGFDHLCNTPQQVLQSAVFRAVLAPLILGSVTMFFLTKQSKSCPAKVVIITFLLSDAVDLQIALL